jgi:hypothetical protein
VTFNGDSLQTRDRLRPEPAGARHLLQPLEIRWVPMGHPVFFTAIVSSGPVILFREMRAAKQGTNPFGNGVPFVKPPYGDQARDNQLIRNGIQAQASGCVQ